MFIFLFLLLSKAKEDEKIDVIGFSPAKGSNEGGFQVFVEVKDSNRRSMWIKIGDSITVATIEDDGRYSVWAPKHENGKVSVEISKDGFNWEHAGDLEYINDYSLEVIIFIIVGGAALSAGFQYVKKYILKHFKVRKSDEGEMKRLLSKPLRSSSHDSMKVNDEIL